MKLADLAETAKDLSNDQFLARFAGPFLLEEGSSDGRSEASRGRMVFELVQPVTRVGRGHGVGVCVLRSPVSGHHAEFRCAPPREGLPGCWRIHDLGSTNGTFVDGVRLGAGIPAEVSDQSVVGLGPIQFAFLDSVNVLAILRRLEIMSTEYDLEDLGVYEDQFFKRDAKKQGPLALIRGVLEERTARQLLTGFDRDQRSGTLVLLSPDGEDAGQISFRSGHLVDATTAEGLRGIKAAKVLLQLEQGRYLFDPKPPAGSRQLPTPLSAILRGVAFKSSRLALALSEAQLRATLENAFHGIVACTDTGEILSLNTRARHMFGEVAESATSLSAILEAGPGQELLATLLSPLGERKIHELCGLRGGLAFPVEVAVTRVLVDGQRTWSLALQDLTERKRAQAALSETQAALHQSQKMDAVGRLAAGISHDFNNLLSVICGYGELLREDLPSGPLRERAEWILQAGAQAAELTKKLLTFCRRQETSPEPHAVNEVVAGVGGILGHLLGSEVELKIFPGKNLAEVLVDKVQLEQVLMNLIVNAREAMPNGGEIRVATTNVVVSDVAGLEPGDYVRLTVTDTGEGMSPEVLANVFEPFFTTKATGTGLGLATVYGIVKQSQGHVTVESVQGAGTTFSVYLPWHTAAAAMPQTTDVSDDNVGTETAISRMATVLVVEDEEGVREFVREVLMEAGFRVLTALDGRDGLSLFKSRHRQIDLLLTDVLMPGLNGQQLVERARQIEPRLRILYMSAHADSSKLEGQPFLQKPLSPKRLLAAVDQALDTIVE